MENIKKACVTGATGYIGKQLTNVLIEQGYEVTVLSRNSNIDFPATVKVIQGDLTSVNCPFEQFLENCNVIFHCAGEINNTKLMRAVHIDGTRRLLQAVIKKAEQKNVPIHWIQLSSVGVYGPPEKANEERVVTESSPVQPKGEYEQTKAEADDLIITASQNKLFTYSIVRPSNVYGGEMPNSTLFSLADVVRRGLYFHIGYLESIATYVHVEDVVDLLVICATDSRTKFEVFNISNDCRLDSLIGSICLALNINSPRVRLPETLVRLLVSIVSIFTTFPLTQERINSLVSRTTYPSTKVKRILNFRPSISVENAIGTVVCDSKLK
mgnify:CR=1 FL=1